MDNLQQPTVGPVQLKPIDDKATAFIIELMKAGKSPSFIVEKLVANGYAYEGSYAAVNQIQEKVTGVHQQKERNNSGTDIVLGAIILIIGIVITVASTNVVAYGAIIVGAIKLIRGISNAAK